MNLKVPSLSEAERIITEAEALNPGAWVSHSRFVAQGAALIAARYPSLDPQSAYVMGFLHDIGRRVGVTGIRHSLDGYHYLCSLGYPAAARICLTHSFPIPEVDSIFGRWDCTDSELDFIRRFLAGVQFTEYDRLIQLCDCLALPTGFCLMEKRFMDVVLRYGSNGLMEQKWSAYLTLFNEIETAIGCSIYSLLPGVVENTFGPGFHAPA